MSREHLRNIFDSIYNGDEDSLELAILELRNNQASQMDTVSILREKLSLSLKEADNIVLNSSVWKDKKAETEKMRSAFDKSFNAISETDEIDKNQKTLWEAKNPKLNFFQRILRKLRR